jgi:hypothetical protein
LAAKNAWVRHATQDIVLTREDYLRYSEHRAALTGIVQALLITRHMLFVGFSLSDDNFHRIADDVRKAVCTPSPIRDAQEAFGTALVLFDDPFMRELWKGAIEFANIGRSTPRESQADFAGLEARRLEIFLDLLLSESASTTAHLMNHDYAAVLSADEQALKDEMIHLRERFKALPGGVKELPAWSDLQALLSRFGDDSPLT